MSHYTIDKDGLGWLFLQHAMGVRVRFMLCIFCMKDTVTVIQPMVEKGWNGSNFDTDECTCNACQRTVVVGRPKIYLRRT